MLIPTLAPDVKYVPPLYDPVYDPIWRTCEELGIVVNAHGGSGAPDYGGYTVDNLLYIMDAAFYSQRPLPQLMLSGVFERFPRLQFVMTELGCAWVPPLLQAHGRRDQARSTRPAARASSPTPTSTSVRSLPSEYFATNCSIGVSQPGPADVEAMPVLGLDHVMWGSDYPHDEGTGPYTREHLRQLFCDWDPDGAPAGARGHRRAALRVRSRRARAARAGVRSDGRARSRSRSPSSPRSRTKRCSRGVPAEPAERRAQRRDTWPVERPSVTVRVLGAVEMVDASGAVRDVPGRRLQALLARLVAEPDRPVAVDALVDAVWPDGLPDAPDAALQTQVYRLRKVLRFPGAPTVATRGPGYAIELGAATVDAIEFEQGVRAAIGAEPSVARARLQNALSLWRGVPYAGFEEVEPLRAEQIRLDEMRLQAIEAHAEALLACGDPNRAITELSAFVLEHPLRADAQATLMRALTATGREAEALRVFQAHRRHLVEELGLEPSPGLRRLEASILRGDTDPAGEPVGGGPRLSIDGLALHRLTGEELDLAWGDLGVGSPVIVVPAWLSNLAVIAEGRDPRSALIEHLARESPRDHLRPPRHRVVGGHGARLRRRGRRRRARGGVGAARRAGRALRDVGGGAHRARVRGPPTRSGLASRAVRDLRERADDVR